MTPAAPTPAWARDLTAGEAAAVAARVEETRQAYAAAADREMERNVGDEGGRWVVDGASAGRGDRRRRRRRR